MKLYGVLAEFDSPQTATTAAEVARAAGFSRLEAYGPFPVAELAEAIGFRENRIARWVLGGAVAGACTGYSLQYYAMVIAYPHNIGGRPLHSWPSFIPITFELAVLGATVVGLFSLFILNGLPRLAHPLFSVPVFERATRDRFFLCLRPDSEAFSAEKAESFLRGQSALSITPAWEEEP